MELADDGTYERETELAQKVVQKAMFDQLRLSVQENPEHEATLAPIIKEMQDRHKRMSSANETKTVEEFVEIVQSRVKVRQQGIDAAREALLELRDRREIRDEVQRVMERNLDLQKLQIGT